MAKTTVNLTDTVTNWVTKTNQISGAIGDLVNLNTTIDSDIVGAINELKTKTDLLDSADITTTARSAFQVLDAGGDGGLVYDSATGNITYTGPSADSARSHFHGGAGIVIDATGDISVDSSTIRGLVSVTDAGGSGSLAYNNSTGVFTYTGPGAVANPATITSSQTFTPGASDDQYVRVNTTSGDITLNIAKGSLNVGQTVVVDKITGGNNLTINWNTSGTSQGISLGNSVDLAVGFYNGTAFSFVETVKS
tara:strand:+ start:13056 stop:13808 length:753 start_codon:yes stop_codon:yes gene_type:complete